MNLRDPLGLSWDCYWDRVMRDTRMAFNAEDVLLEEGLTLLVGDREFAQGLLGTYDALDDAEDAWNSLNDLSGSLNRQRTLAQQAAKGLLKGTTAVARGAGAFTGAALNPFADHSLGSTVGNSLYDSLN